MPYKLTEEDAKEIIRELSMKRKEYTKEQKAALRAMVTYIGTFKIGTSLAVLISLQMDLLTCDNDEVEQMELVMHWLELFEGLVDAIRNKDMQKDLSMLVADLSEQFPKCIEKVPMPKGAAPEEPTIN